MSSGPAGLFLGIHDCNGGGGGPVYPQSVGTWQPVAYTNYNITFCLLSYSNDGSGTFTGTLDWN
ncbi:MAG: hypothetical protein QM589_03720 [Thermomicrobiales bacterium]